MRVITFQSKEVLDLVMKNGVCYPIKNIRFDNAPKTYERLINDYNEKMHMDYKSLFYVWVKVHEDVEICIDDDHISRCDEMTPIAENSVCLLLDVPDSLLLVTSFYNYTDMMYDEEIPGEITAEWEWIYDIENAANFEQQGVIPFISKDMIIEVFENLNI